MDGLLSFLLFAGLFFLMMRFGCGAHILHGHRGHRRHIDSGDAEHQIDPVCGKPVEAQHGYGKMHRGRLYRFCSRACLDRFDENPAAFVSETKRLDGGDES